MTNVISKNNRIAKNTILLYIRMLVIMAVTLYTSRVVLKVLGVEDFGVYNVVGGVVTMLSFLNSSLTTSTQRFLNYEMASNDRKSLRVVFSNAEIAHIIIAVISAIMIEVIGLWLLYNKLDIPSEQFNAALWVFHFSVLSFFITVISSPYNAAIIAHERMDIYAYFSIVEVFLKLFSVYLLYMIPYNKLIVYGFMNLLVCVIIRIIYNLYCYKNFTECKGAHVLDLRILRKLFGFSGWMIFGCISDTLSKQGVNILINIFFGPALNASRAIAVQVQSAVNMFVTNFMTAVKPQIIKKYAAGQYESMYKLVFSSSKMSYYLLLILTVPVLIYTKNILTLWLVNVPEQCVIFTRLVLIELLITAAYTPIAQVNQASGKIKRYQIAIAVIYILNFAFTFGAYKIGLPAYYTFVVSIIMSIIGLFVRVFILKIENHFPAKEYLIKIMLPLIPTTSIIYVLQYALKYFSGGISFINILPIILIGATVSCVIIYFVGLNIQERNFIKSNIKLAYNKFKK